MVAGLRKWRTVPHAAAIALGAAAPLTPAFAADPIGALYPGATIEDARRTACSIRFLYQSAASAPRIHAFYLKEGRDAGLKLFADKEDPVGFRQIMFVDAGRSTGKHLLYVIIDSTDAVTHGSVYAVSSPDTKRCTS